MEVSERNLLVAENLGRVLERYDRDVKAEFRLLVLTVADGLDPAEAHVLLDNLNFRHIFLADPETRRVRFSINGEDVTCPEFVPADHMVRFRKIAAIGTPMFSGVLTGPDGMSFASTIAASELMKRLRSVCSNHFGRWRPHR